MKSDDKLFMHSIFALVCLLIRFFNDLSLLISGSLVVGHEPIEYAQLVNQLMAAIHCLGGSVFFIIISKAARTGYCKFYGICDYFKQCRISHSFKTGIPITFIVPPKSS
uniref:Uncharacterized protein n=1 Tax=Panagrolaimus sp. JU765 TaxID=591449 RepID=A0AC34QEU3_9BILA